MPPMPYHFEKGPELSVLEDFLNADQARAAETLDKLRRGEPLHTLAYMTAPSAQDPSSSISLLHHIYRDWFGWSRPGGRLPPPGTPPPLPAKPLAAQRVGYWTAYQGDVEQIVRLTFVRALEVSLGVPHAMGASTPASVPTQHWPIDISWKCAQAWFEGWVWWRRINSEGVVMLVLATPSTGTPLLPNISGGTPGVVDPPGAVPAPDQGMWVISHEGNDQAGPYVNVSSPAGDWMGYASMPVTRGVGNVITWELAERDGGVRPNGRAYP